MAASLLIFSCDKNTPEPPPLGTTVELTAALNGAN